MLVTVREHALEHLRAQGALEPLQRRHAERFLTLALAAEPNPLARARRSGSLGWKREFDNLATALDWLLSSDRVEDALRATSALGRFWRAHAIRA